MRQYNARDDVAKLLYVEPGAMVPLEMKETFEDMITRAAAVFTPMVRESGKVGGSKNPAPLRSLPLHTDKGDICDVPSGDGEDYSSIKSLTPVGSHRSGDLSPLWSRVPANDAQPNLVKHRKLASTNPPSSEPMIARGSQSTSIIPER